MPSPYCTWSCSSTCCALRIQYPPCQYWSRSCTSSVQFPHTCWVVVPVPGAVVVPVTWSRDVPGLSRNWGSWHGEYLNWWQALAQTTLDRLEAWFLYVLNSCVVWWFKWCRSDQLPNLISCDNSPKSTPDRSWISNLVNCEVELISVFLNSKLSITGYFDGSFRSHPSLVNYENSDRILLCRNWIYMCNTCSICPLVVAPKSEYQLLMT